MKISTKLKILPLCILMMTLVSAAIIQLSYQGIYRNASHSKMVVGVIVNIYELNSLTFEYLQYQEPRPLVQWQLQNKELQEQLESLKLEEQYSDQVIFRLINLQQKLTILFTQIVQEHDTMAEGSGQSLTSEQLVVHLRDQISVTLYSMVDLAVVLSKKVNSTQVKTHKNIGWGLFWISVISGMVLVVFSFTIARSIFHPLNKLKDAADIVGSGDFKHQIHSQKRDELGDLSRNFDFMVRRLQQETDNQRQLQAEVRHLDRVAMLGTLTAAIAHEINQPLAAILTNAQAAKRYLGFQEPDLEEVEDALTDIIADDKRAAEVIRRLRALLNKTEYQPEALDINIIVKEILALLKSDIVIKKVRTQEDYQTSLPRFYGDRIQIQQVILNLFMNSLDTVDQNLQEDRFIIITTRKHDSETISVSIRDSGGGIQAANTDELFEPFYTTKDHGLGMGLPICKTIIENHNGRIWADNNSDRGATFTFTLPVQNKLKNHTGLRKG